MTEDELQLLVEKISIQFFNKPFLHQAFFNQRLQTTGGRYHASDHHL
ncbi:SprT family protein, partial [Tetragenococcus halophilus]